MKLRPRLDKLERIHAPKVPVNPNARAELLRRLERGDPETRARVLRAISERRP